MINEHYDKFILIGAAVSVLSLFGVYAYNYIALMYEMLQLTH